MQVYMKMLQERSKRKIIRLLTEEAVRYRDGGFLYKVNNKPVEGIYYKKKYWEELGIEDPVYGAEEQEGIEDEAEVVENEVQAVEEKQPEKKEEVETAQPVEPLKNTEEVKVEEQVSERSGIKINF